MKRIKLILAAAVGSASLFTFTSCDTNAGTGALAGGVGGAGLGALIDSNNRGRGALIGGAAGAVTGSIVGKAQDDRNRAAEYQYYQNQQYYNQQNQGGYRP